MSKKLLWTGRVISGLAALLILFAAIPKLFVLAPMVEGFQQAGFPATAVFTVGVIELGCAVLYLIPRTRVLGAILMTGLMGGATAANVRVSNPAMIMTVLIGMLAWVGLFFRDERVRALLPLRS
jgi:hypothetical protein